MSDSVVPARTCRSAPGLRPSRIVTLVAVTARPSLSSRPVPRCRLPKRAVVYQSVRHGVAGFPESARAARRGLSPRDGPPGPYAVALTGVTAGRGERGAADAREARAGADAGGACAGADARGACAGARAAGAAGREPPAWVVSLMAAKPMTTRQSR